MNGDIVTGAAFAKAIRAIVLLAIAGTAFLLSTPSLAQGEESWRLDPYARVEAGFVSAESTTRDEQLVVDGDALTLRGQVGVDLEDDNTRFRIEADRIELFRLGEGRSDSARDRFTASLTQEFGSDWEVALQARHYDDFVTAESNDTDEWSGAAMVVYEPVREHRFRVQGTWREREYDNGDDPATTGEGPRVDVDYRRRFGRYHYLTFDLRAESIRSDDPEREYSRESAKVSYTRPITPDLRVRPAIEVLQTRFDGRFAPDGNARQDRLIVPEVELLYWPGQWRIEAEAKYIFSDSNQPLRAREGYRFTLTAGYVF